MNGYAGKILRIDLSRGKIVKDDFIKMMSKVFWRKRIIVFNKLIGGKKWE